MKKTSPLLIMLIAYLLLVLLLGLLASCNPVKQVLKDEYKMRKVWNEGALDGWCVNDTTIVNKSDTSYFFDTIYKIEAETLIKDSLINLVTTKVKYVTKTVRITDTFTNIVTDNSRIDLLQKEIDKKRQDNIELDKKLVASISETKEAKQDRNDWRLRCWILGIAFIMYLLRRPLIKLISPIKL